MKHIVVLLSIVLLNSSCFSQIESFSPKPSPLMFREKGMKWFLLKTFPSRVYNPINTGLEFGLEIRNLSRFSTEVRVAQLFKKNARAIQSSWFPHRRGYNFHIEERFYLNKLMPNGIYIALGLSHLWSREYQNWDMEYSLENEYYHYNDTILILKNFTDITMKYGFQKTANRFVIGFDFGIGLRYKNIRHQDKQIENSWLVKPKGGNVNYDLDHARNKWVFTIPISFHLGLVL